MKAAAIWFLITCVGLGACRQSGKENSAATSSTTSVEQSSSRNDGETGKLSPGEVVTSPPVVDADKLYPFNDGYAVVEKGSAHGLINQTGGFSIPYNQYIFGVMTGNYWEESGRFHPVNNNPGFHRGLCLIGKRSQDQYGRDVTLWGCINTKKEIVIPLNYTRFIRQTGTHMFFQTTQGNAICLDRKGKEVFFPEELPRTEVRSRYDKYWAVKSSSQYLYGNENVLTVQSYTANGHTYSLFNFKGEAVSDLVFNDLDNFSEGLAAFMQNDDFGKQRWGYVNTKGQIVLPGTCSNQPGSFHCGLAWVEPKDKSTFSYAYINKKGEVKLQLPYAIWGRNNLDFRNGLILMPRGKGYMDTEGKTYPLDIIKGSFKDIQSGQIITNVHDSEIVADFRPDQILFRHNGKTGLTNMNGTLIIPPVFEELSLFDGISGLARAVFFNPNTREQREGYINTSGVFVIIKAKTTQW